ncbi:MAG: class I SAM-dependent methyltransferase [Coriobacteriales bacterium]|nr:class I SAM-dependent methyltransferase [Coriobacteriales bacterium]
MDILTAKRLCAITDNFYSRHADSFSATRQSAWQGWEKCLEVTGVTGQGALESEPHIFSVLDVACGNLRFFSYLSQQVSPQTRFSLYAVDNCDALLMQDGMTARLLPEIHFYKLDIMQELLEGKSIAKLLGIHGCNLVTCFGFMHHIPGQDMRSRFISDLVEMCAPGGYVALSLWQFMKDAKFALKAQDVHKKALPVCNFAEKDLDEGDYLLGWQGLPVEPGNIRYAHSFSDSELMYLIESATPCARLISRFEADGKSSNLNTYLIFKK